MPKTIVDIDYQQITNWIKNPGPNQYAINYLQNIYQIETKTQTIFKHAKPDQKMLITMHLINLKYLIQKVELMYLYDWLYNQIHWIGADFRADEYPDVQSAIHKLQIQTHNILGRLNDYRNPFVKLELNNIFTAIQTEFDPNTVNHNQLYQHLNTYIINLKKIIDEDFKNCHTEIETNLKINADLTIQNINN